jgi:hypothetical protein
MRQNSTTAANGFYSRWSSCVKIFGKPKDANETVKYGQRFVALSSKSQAPHLSKLENGNCQKIVAFAAHNLRQNQQVVWKFAPPKNNSVQKCCV